MRDSSLATMVTQDIALARGAFVNGFIFDWYYNDGKRFYERLIQTFLSSIHEVPDFKFSLLWVNHDNFEWKFDYQNYDVEKMMAIFASEYAAHQNYLQIDGRFVSGIFDVNAIKAAMGVRVSALSSKGSAMRLLLPVFLGSILSPSMYTNRTMISERWVLTRQPLTMLSQCTGLVRSPIATRLFEP